MTKYFYATNHFYPNSVYITVVIDTQIISETTLLYIRNRVLSGCVTTEIK